ncbi:MAG TPA: C_GCAxxG_C_C family protein [Dehalococcoidia bacterium]|nr:C_GCAxxG_C_C family protein [Dehalococcoidia bacterium]
MALVTAVEHYSMDSGVSTCADGLPLATSVHFRHAVLLDVVWLVIAAGSDTERSESMSPEKSREEILDEVERKAGEYEIQSGCCAQGCLRALQEQFGIGDSLTYKAATAMPGIALRGETCGGVIGGLMAIGLVFGREEQGDMDSYFRAIAKGRRFCKRFEEEFGTVMCRDIVRERFGKDLNLADPEDAKEFTRMDGFKRCAYVPGRAARIVAEMILDSQSK